MRHSWTWLTYYNSWLGSLLPGVAWISCRIPSMEGVRFKSKTAGPRACAWADIWIAHGGVTWYGRSTCVPFTIPNRRVLSSPTLTNVLCRIVISYNAISISSHAHICRWPGWFGSLLESVTVTSPRQWPNHPPLFPPFYVTLQLITRQS
jgi:hypothetical protein